MQTAMDPVSGYPDPVLVNHTLLSSAVSWPAIAAGTVVAAATSLLLVALGAGAGVGALSPWPHAGASVTTFTVMTALGLIVVQWLSAGIGGYVTGRLRTKWASLHTHEVFFRDTAHGFITWAAATLLVSAAAAIMAASTVDAGVLAVSSSVSASPTGAIDAYDVDRLLRPASLDTLSAANSSALSDIRAQITRILAAGLLKGDVPPADQAYLTQVVSAEARVSSADAQTRVDTAVAKIKADHEQAHQAADAARKAAQSASIFTALAMLIGAFIACIAAALGGHRRDAHA
jgi:hypothetical protein